jgi:hypothetical protein
MVGAIHEATHDLEVSSRLCASRQRLALLGKAEGLARQDKTAHQAARQDIAPCILKEGQKVKSETKLKLLNVK